MMNRLPFSEFVDPVAEYLRTHSDAFARSGPAWIPPDAVAKHRGEIKRCADDMAHATDYHGFEATLERMHKLGAFPPLGLVC